LARLQARGATASSAAASADSFMNDRREEPMTTSQRIRR
jgi:hypothetical protein